MSATNTNQGEDRRIFTPRREGGAWVLPLKSPIIPLSKRMELSYDLPLPLNQRRRLTPKELADIDMIEISSGETALVERSLD